MAQETLSAPLALIKVNGIVVGKMQNIRCTETYRRQPVVGIGTILPQEMVLTGWNGTLSCRQFMIDLRKEIFPGSLLRNVQTVQQWEDTVLLNSTGIQIDILRKVAEGGTTLPNGVIVPKLKVFASIKASFITREGFDISEGQISGRDADFDYMTPIIFPL